MSWLLWRQHRSQAMVAGIAVALFGVAVAITGIHMAAIYREYVRTCAGNGACNYVGRLFQGYGAIVDTVHLAEVVPLLLGAFLGATLVARETEHATNTLVWAQTVTRRRWLVAKVVTALVATVVVSVAVSSLVTWWSGTPNSYYGNRFDGAQFDTQNVAPVAFALFAVALGIAAGSYFRRTLPALATTVAGYAGVRLAVAVYLRPHYLAPVTGQYAVGASNLPSGSWTISQYLASPTGQVVSNHTTIPAACLSDRVRAQTCLARLGFHTVAKYQPASRYWHFQLVESGLFVALATALVTFAVVRTMRHDA